MRRGVLTALSALLAAVGLLWPLVPTLLPDSAPLQPDPVSITDYRADLRVDGEGTLHAEGREVLTVTTGALAPRTPVTLRTNLDVATPDRETLPWPVAWDAVLGRSVPVAVLLGILAVTGLLVGRWWERRTRERTPGLPVMHEPPESLGPVQTVYVTTEHVPDEDLTATLLHQAELGLTRPEPPGGDGWVIEGAADPEQWEATDPVARRRPGPRIGRGRRSVRRRRVGRSRQTAAEHEVPDRLRHPVLGARDRRAQPGAVGDDGPVARRGRRGARRGAVRDGRDRDAGRSAVRGVRRRPGRACSCPVSAPVVRRGAGSCGHGPAASAVCCRPLGRGPLPRGTRSQRRRGGTVEGARRSPASRRPWHPRSVPARPRLLLGRGRRRRQRRRGRRLLVRHPREESAATRERP